ncbi:TraR/DksA family transcriptional regulator [Brachybacterium rhamnosum]|uniref:TraR/DksA family transcriptional regulator n=1 Tax=Brachybacterium rhamnosum TaxID=173361 RepID=A0ABW4PWB3_9MICO|nr:TraR/DksA C4-type zinc finger protein [Brachybacterium sp. SGAir0954]QCR54886.1 molecular chaperone DnaK [Brachybacterium sp. SGAir0954]
MESSQQDLVPPGDRAAQLAERRAAARAQLEEIEQELVALRRTREGEADDDEHDPDGVPLSAQWSRLEGLRLARLDALAGIDEAQERLRRGEDGRCARCGKPIAPARLAVRPEATTCIDCADLVD